MNPISSGRVKSTLWFLLLGHLSIDARLDLSSTRELYSPLLLLYGVLNTDLGVHSSPSPLALDPWNRKPWLDLAILLDDHFKPPGGDGWTCISMGGEFWELGKDQERNSGKCTHKNRRCNSKDGD